MKSPRWHKNEVHYVTHGFINCVWIKRIRLELTFEMLMMLRLIVVERSELGWQSKWWRENDWTEENPYWLNTTDLHGSDQPDEGIIWRHKEACFSPGSRFFRKLVLAGILSRVFFCIMCLHIGEQGRVLKFNPLHFLASMQRLAGGRMCRSMQGAAKNSKGRIERFQGIKVQVGSSAVQYFAMQM